MVLLWGDILGSMLVHCIPLYQYFSFIHLLIVLLKAVMSVFYFTIALPSKTTYKFWSFTLSIMVARSVLLNVLEYS